MRLDDLVKVYRDAFWGVKRADDDGDRAGIREVVEALRDEIIPERMMISSQSVVHAADLRLLRALSCAAVSLSFMATL